MFCSIDRQQRADGDRDVKDDDHRSNEVQHAVPAMTFELPQQMLFRTFHDLVSCTPARWIQRCVSGCGLAGSALCLKQRLERLLIGATFNNQPLPAAVPHHRLNLAIDSFAIRATALFCQDNVRKDNEGQD
jgi:hypothetical protein